VRCFLWRSAARKGLKSTWKKTPDALHPAEAVLLRCIKFDVFGVGANPDAKKYRLAVSFLVVLDAFGVYFSLYNTKTRGELRSLQPRRLMEEDR
jgi:hypothetical protein